MSNEFLTIEDTPETKRRGRPPKADAPQEDNGTPATNMKLKPELQRDVDVALEAQRQLIDSLERRAKSPDDLSVGMFQENDPLLALQMRHCPEAVDKIGPDGKVIKGTMSTFVDEPGNNGANHERHLAEGWVPVINDRGEQVRFGACYMYKRPRAISDAQLAANTARSRKRLRAYDDSMQKANEEAMRSIKSKMVLEESLSVSGGGS